MFTLVTNSVNIRINLGKSKAKVVLAGSERIWRPVSWTKPQSCRYLKN